MTSQRRIGKIRVETRETLTSIEVHPLYQRLNNITALQVFMEHHVFAVWDFMSLLKALQNHLTCTRLPWRPVGDPDVRRFVNEIVQCEESDHLPNGRSVSHFELYIEAMRAIGANTKPIETFIDAIERGETVEVALEAADAPKAAKVFVMRTFSIIEEGEISAIAAAFTFGREQALPSIFHQLVRQLERHERRDLSPLVTYLDRHIEVDGGDHGWLAEKLLSSCNGDVEEHWIRSGSAAQEALNARLQLWDGVFKLLPEESAEEKDSSSLAYQGSSNPRDVFWTRVIAIVSVVVSAAVGFLILGPRPEALSGQLDVSGLPLVNSLLNAATSVLLIWAVFEVKRGALRRHQNLMLAAFGFSALFLVTYVIYHWFKAGPKTYEGQFRGLYLSILLSHIVLAVAILPMALMTLYRGWTMDRVKHRRLAKWTFPTWLYVSVTGVLIYVMAHT